MIVCLLLGGACGIAAAFSVNIIMFGALRFVLGACFNGVALMQAVASK